MIVKSVTYGEGGFDPSAPNDNIMESHDIEIPDPEPVAADDLIANVAAMSDEQKADLRAALGL